jgi:hypothetical protein
MVYLFRNSVTGEVREVIQGMNEAHTYEAEGVIWDRVFTVPNMAMDSKIDGSQEQFLTKTNKPGTLGDLMDRSREFSEKREQIYGKDPVKEKAFEDYSKKRGGRRHLEQVKQESATINF